MPATAVLPENYCVCVGEDGAPREIGRSASAVTYKAMGYQSGQPVALQLIPLASVSETGRAQFELKARTVRKLKHPNIARVFDVRVEGDHLVFATEYLQGETAEQWVVANGPMPADAVLRIALQVVSALAEAAFHGLSHRAIQPSNLMIVNGAAPDGDWPFVKLLNFGLAGLKLYSEGADELVPPISAAFASPEQREKGKVDFASEIFSLGATMCFLLTGAVPLAGRTRKEGEGERVLPAGRSIPGPVRKLLHRMLRIAPEERPRDPLLLTDELRQCLQKVERRRPNSRQVAVPLGTEVAARGERSRWLVPLLTAAAGLLLLAALGSVLLPNQMRFWANRNRPIESIGVPIGIPENMPATQTNEQAAPPPMLAANSPGSATPAQPATSIAPRPSPQPTPAAIAESTPVSLPTPAAIAESTPVSQPTPAAVAESTPVPLPTPVETSTVASSPSPAQPIIAEATEPPAQSPAGTEMTANNRTAEPPPPEEAPPPSGAVPPPEKSETSPLMAEQPASSGSQPETENTATAEPPVATNHVAKTATSRNPTADAAPKSARTKSLPSRRSKGRWSSPRSVPPMRVGNAQAQFVRTTEDGKLVLRLPSGETVVTPPLPETNASDAPVISHRRVRKVQIPPRALPANDGPPVIVLPPDTP